MVNRLSDSNALDITKRDSLPEYICNTLNCERNVAGEIAAFFNVKITLIKSDIKKQEYPNPTAKAEALQGAESRHAHRIIESLENVDKCPVNGSAKSEWEEAIVAKVRAEYNGLNQDNGADIHRRSNTQTPWHARLAKEADARYSPMLK